MENINWTWIIQQLATNTVLGLLALLLAKIPVIGPWIKKVVDALIGNLPHNTPPPPPPTP